MNIAIFPDSTLRFKSAPVTRVTDETRELVRLMTSLMDDAGGIGLAAPQCGVPLQIFITRIRELRVFINPVIEDLGEGTVVSTEGCLSLPGVAVHVPRFKTVDVRFMGMDEVEQRLVCRDLMSFCVQHEADHLNGVLMIDRVDNAARIKACWQMWNATHPRLHP